MPKGANEREFFIDNLLVRIHFIIEMIRWTGLAPWEFKFPFHTLLQEARKQSAPPLPIEIAPFFCDVSMDGSVKYLPSLFVHSSWEKVN